MNSSIAISVKNLSKTFRIPHEKVNTLKGAFVGALKKKTFGEFKALDDVSFEVKKGEFFGIIGRNGSGKSTLLKILAGIYRADCGRIQVNGRISPFLELGIGFNPELSGRDNIYLNASVLGLSKKQIDKKFDEIVAFSELERFIDQKLKNYSSGMQVRLAFSVSIHANRDILLMDEVLAVGDTNFQSKCLEEFLKLKEMGKTVVLVSHDITAIRQFCSKALLLKNGIAASYGETQKVINAYSRDNLQGEENKYTSKKNNEPKNNSNARAKIAEVLSVKFLDKDAKTKNIFENGEEINVDVVYLINKKIVNPVFGIVVRDRKKNNIFITNTSLKKPRTGIFECSRVRVNYRIVNSFSQGDYFVSPAVASETGLISYDWKDDLGKFSIISGNFSLGLVSFEHDIKIKPE